MTPILLVSIIVLVELSYGFSVCPGSLPPSPYVKVHNGHCYEFRLLPPVSWNQAENDCKSKGGHLVVINSNEEQQFLLSTLYSMRFPGNPVWIGLTDVKQEGRFLWNSGERLSYSNWAPGQPGNHFGKRRFIGHVDEDCVAMLYLDWGRWHDVTCDAHLVNPYICEYSTHHERPTSTPSPATSKAMTSSHEVVTTANLQTTTRSVRPSTTPKPIQWITLK